MKGLITAIWPANLNIVAVNKVDGTCSEPETHNISCD